MRLIEWDESYLAELVQLWNEELGHAFPMREELFEQNSFRDINVMRDGSLIALDEQNDVIGFIISKYWQERLDIKLGDGVGWIQACVVRRSFQRQGIGTILLQKAEEALKTVGADTIHIGRDPWHYFPGVPTSCQYARDWVEKNGYIEVGREYDLLNEGEGDFPYPDEFTGVVFRLLQENEQDKLLSFLHQHFPGRWEYEAIKYFQKGGTGWEFVIAVKDKEIVGFCRINDHQSPFIAQNVYWAPHFEEPLGGIGPLGVSSAERGQGYGFGVVQAGIYFLRQRGLGLLVIDWTGLVDFYRKFGFEPWKEYISYTKGDKH